MSKMYDKALLKEKYGLDYDDFCSWADYLKAKVNTIRKNNLEAVKCNYDGYGIYDIYSFNGDCKFDVVVLYSKINPMAQVFVNHFNKTVSPVHGYPSLGKKLAKTLGYEYKDIYIH